MGRKKGFDVNAFNWFPYGEGHDVPAEVPGGWHGLYMSESLSVKQAVGILEAISGGCCEQPNQYVVLNGQRKKNRVPAGAAAVHQIMSSPSISGITTTHPFW